MTKQFYKGYELHINDVVANPNSRKSQTVLIYKGNNMIAASYADIDIEDPISKAKTKVDFLTSEGTEKMLYWAESYLLPYLGMPDYETDEDNGKLFIEVELPAKDIKKIDNNYNSYALPLEALASREGYNIEILTDGNIATFVIS